MHVPAMHEGWFRACHPFPRTPGCSRTSIPGIRHLRDMPFAVRRPPSNRHAGHHPVRSRAFVPGMRNRRCSRRTDVVDGTCIRPVGASATVATVRVPHRWMRCEAGAASGAAESPDWFGPSSQPMYPGRGVSKTHPHPTLPGSRVLRSPGNPVLGILPRPLIGARTCGSQARRFTPLKGRALGLFGDLRCLPLKGRLLVCLA